MDDDKGKRTFEKVGKVKLFGFKLNDTSGVLLFISSILLTLSGMVLLYTGFQTFNLTQTFPTVYFMVGSIMVGIGLYIMFTSMKVRE